MDGDIAPDTLPSPRNTKSGRTVKVTRPFTDSEGEGTAEPPGDTTHKTYHQAPPKRVRQEQTGVGWLNAILRRITSTLRRDTHPQAAIHKLFDEPVTTAEVGDYNEYVPEDSQMALSLMERASRARRYRGRWELRANCEQIIANARMYNLHSPHGSPEVVGFAEALLAALDSELLRLSPELDDAEAMFIRDGGQLSAAKMPEGWLARTEAAAAHAASLAAQLENMPAPQPQHLAALTNAAPVPAHDISAAVDGDVPGAAQMAEGHVMVTQPLLTAAKEEWVQCSRCEKWRKVSAAALAVISAAGDDAPWFCEQNTDDPARASCDVSDEAF